MMNFLLWENQFVTFSWEDRLFDYPLKSDICQISKLERLRSDPELNENPSRGAVSVQENKDRDESKRALFNILPSVKLCLT